VSQSSWSDLFLLVVLVVCAVTDIREGRIRNVITYPALLLAIARAGAEGASELRLAGLGVVAGALPLYLMFAAGWMGGGDVKLMAVVGAWKGAPFVLASLFNAIFIAGVCAAVVLIWRGHARGVLADVRMLVGAGPGARTAVTARAGSFPFGVAICAGTLLAWSSGGVG
jgi:prepilin peptidase CpaA